MEEVSNVSQFTAEEVLILVFVDDTRGDGQKLLIASGDLS